MSGDNQSHDHRIDELSDAVRNLSRRVDDLSGQVERLAAERPQTGILELGGPRATAKAAQTPSPPDSEMAEAPAATSILSSVATVCFVLVVALILRTLVDSGYINQRLGAFVGMGYAGLLIAYGYRWHARGRHGVPVYTLAGPLLLFSIVYETYARFDLLPAVAAYAILGAVLLVTAHMTLRYRIASALSVGVPGASLVGFALDFPDPPYVYLAALLLLASAASCAASRISKCGWLRWGMVAITLFFWLVWTVKVRAGATAGYDLALPWLFPSLLAFVLLYVGMTFWPLLRKGWAFGPFERVLPVITAIWVYTVAWAVVIPWGGQASHAGAGGAVAALGCMAVAAGFARKQGKGSPGALSFTLAAVLLLVASLPVAVESRLLLLLLWALAGIGLFVLSGIWEILGIRVVSYLLQVFTCAIAVLTPSLTLLGEGFPLAAAIAVALLCAVCLGHRAWRSRSIQASGAETAPFMGALLLLVALLYGFGLFRMTLYSALGMLQVSGESAFQAGQSISINVAALALILVAQVRMNAEVLAVAAIVSGLGALKVFGYDLFNTQGLPLVLSVASFGMTAAIGSLVWNRWQHQNSDGRGIE